MTTLGVDTRIIEGDTPAQRLLALLEVIAEKDQYFTLQSLVDETGLPKPTLHRMLQQLENSGMLQREADNRHYSKGSRLRRLAETLLLNDTVQGARHGVLAELVREVGESCNITALSGSEVLYLDRVETSAPLRFYLHPGSRVPAHCSASGKLFLAQMGASQRRRLLADATLEAFTRNTLTDIDAIEAEIEQVKRDGYAFDDEEFLPGLLCIAVLAPNPAGVSNVGLAIQAPVMRMDRQRALDCLPALERAAAAIARINQGALPESDATGEDTTEHRQPIA
ncbi:MULTISPECIES: IclR family transcriptional regulator [Halomonas]|uniref:IclR family transcriptional regulator n=1 Tax=Halomonas TaxID=2745 RepID=UPI001A90477F|nr:MULTISPECIES: IclR family transcriptional regulator [Halomonas]MBN8413230.1 IclR family transcriptional regulator [Halomonas litopenaei]MBY5924198.1 IclR family transcriptional regulator [Halomonas sp. DP4Y7-2]MBY5928366.1 IclR family transcriptional regulator [Halomonas sp. DP8Y7-3]MBY5982598.1 IclR family transcriptional regulator [Halomonas sp. DP5Y7-2]MBY6231240.1 IclR family transcriptional regulator [Halomonas sp. DP4Y7-1]